jgi:magnesium-transporting ATPase (P-type)
MWVILAVVIINAILGVIQEDKAEKALDSIRNLLSLKSDVIRDVVTYLRDMDFPTSDRFF